MGPLLVCSSSVVLGSLPTVPRTYVSPRSALVMAKSLLTLLLLVSALTAKAALAGRLTAMLPLLVVRTLGEEHLLQKELPGYAAYMRRVRWRFCPGVW